MKYNNELTILREIHNIENAKGKFFFIGFMVSLAPFLLILLIASKLNVSNTFMYIILSFTIIASLLNAISLSTSVHKKLILFFENKYDCNYKEIKESIN